MNPRSSLLAIGLALGVLAAAVPAHAARAIMDLHRLDANFALFARDTNVPWKTSSVRLDTYSSAPVDFAAYQVDPADVIVAGSNARPRVISTRNRKPVTRWRFTPPGGYRFQSNDVDVPLGSREGFFVVEARRGNVGEQVWINRTRIGLITKETPAGIVLYGADLGSGKALARMRVSFVVNARFVERTTDAHGIVKWNATPRPIFALAQWGASRAFVSFLPQAPLPGTIVGIALDASEIHAGDSVRAVGFARSRAGSSLRPARGDARVILRYRGAVVEQRTVHLDPAGSFEADLPVSTSSAAGDYTVLATVNGAAAGANVHVNANPGGLALSVSAECETACSGNSDVPLTIRSMREGAAVPNVNVAVNVIRSPHAYVTGENASEPWGITQWLDTSVRTDASGVAHVLIPHPSDGLASTYGIRVSGGNATADTRVTAPTANLTLRVEVERNEQSVGPLTFDVSATRGATTAPAAHVAVRMQLIHGSSVQEQTLTLDDRGHARGVFTSPQPGSNLIIARADDGGQAMDAQQVQVEPQSLQVQRATGSDVRIGLDRTAYSPGTNVQVDASASGAQGDAFFTYEAATSTDARVVSSSGGDARASLRAANAPGSLQIGAAFVRDGSIVWDSAPVVLDAPGRPLTLSIAMDKDAYQTGEIAHVNLGGDRAATLVVRVTRGTPSGSADFESVPQLLALATTTTQVSAPAFATWHPWVDSTGNHDDIDTFVRRTAAPQTLTIADTQTQNVSWAMERHQGGNIDVAVPKTPGRYTLSILSIGDDGRVSAASRELEVR